MRRAWFKEAVSGNRSIVSEKLEIRPHRTGIDQETRIDLGGRL